MTIPPLLEVEDLHVTFPGRSGPTEAVRGLHFCLSRERLGIVGESGSGKTTAARAILGLIAPPGEVRARKISLAGRDLCGLRPKEWRSLRGRRMSMILQDAKYALNPVRKIGHQIMETYLLHFRAGSYQARRRTLDMLEAVKIRDPETVFHLYPHQLSGGMGQRVMIAMMLIAEPDLLIADEPTSALDVTVQNHVLRILDDLVTERGMGLIFISHNLPIVSSFCDRVLVMYGGKLLEDCAASALQNARHPYTRALLAAVPSLDRPTPELATVTRDPAWLT
jgi:peptide/nickel transport system ATP-binding protein